jgi:hypothetical protein
MSSVMKIPRQERPWGMVTWMADLFRLSRPALYSLSECVSERKRSPAVTAGLSTGLATVNSIEVTANRLARTVLTASLPGKMAIRPLRWLLAEAFDQSRSVGWINELCRQAGGRAGQILRQVDTSPLGIVIAARDETFFHRQPLLLVIEPVSTTILLAEVSDDRQADTWGAA